ncbi:MAG TPA: tRNA lysidine(34) synthetase TilS [Pseudolabrys sp.]|nr:tRNA lysidine(34) synthetase TilS [Pseudolabrys sp.]
MRTAEPTGVSASEAKALFAELQNFPALVLAVSGGPDSTALMMLAADWRRALKVKPKLVAVTVDHRLRKESKREADDVARIAHRLGVPHRTLRWTGHKPAAGLQEAARAVRYRMLGEAAREAGASHILTAHTLDDQAETVLIRMSRGSGLTGLGAMSRLAPLPATGFDEITLVRPLLDIPKNRLVATLRAAKISYADDPSNLDPRFARVRMRSLMAALAAEGLDATRLARLARRFKRADAAIESVVDNAAAELVADMSSGSSMTIETGRFIELPSEVALRLLGRAIAEKGDEGPVELGKLESFKSGLDEAQKARNPRFRRTLAGAIVTLAGSRIVVERAPPRRRKALTKRRPRGSGRPKTR